MSVGGRHRWSGRASALVLLAIATAAPALPPGSRVAAEPGLPPPAAGWTWVRSHPLLVSALIPSMGAPPTAVADDYFGSFGSSAVHLWVDGAAEIAGWQAAHPDAPFLVWLGDDGASVAWDGTGWVSTGMLAGGLEPGLPGRIGYQVGDEPRSLEQLEAVDAAGRAVREADPGALVVTNLSYWSPERDEIFAYYRDEMESDILMVSDYLLSGLHYTVLGTIREVALGKGVPYWHYLNAYVGAESGFRPLHTESDLRWTALTGLAHGFTGFSWFLYQAAAVGHESATTWGGSVLFDDVGTWSAERTAQWEQVASINAELANLGRTATQLTSTDVRLITANDPLVIRPVGTRDWMPGAGGDPYLTAIGPADGELPMDVVVGFFEDAAGEGYIMVQNARHTHSLGPYADPLPGADRAGRIDLEFDFSAAPDALDRSRLEYVTGSDERVRVLSLVPIDGDRVGVTLTLRPGAALLFKYANDAPFRIGPATEEVGLVDPATGLWQLRTSAATRSFYYGDPGDVPFAGDWDCDGVDTPGLYRQSDGFVYLRNSNTQGNADLRFFFGNPGDVPLAGDFDGDGCDTVSLYRPGEARVYVINELGSGDQGLGSADLDFGFGDPGDDPFVGDFDRDGVDTVALHRPATGLVYLRNSLSAGGADASFIYGDPGDLVLAGAWRGGGSTVGLYRPADGHFYLSDANEAANAAIVFPFGEAGQVPIRGNFAPG